MQEIILLSLENIFWSTYKKHVDYDCFSIESLISSCEPVGLILLHEYQIICFKAEFA